MALALNASCFRWSFNLVQSPAAVVMTPRRTNGIATIRPDRPVFSIAPTTAQPLAMPAVMRRSRSVSDTLAKLMAKGEKAFIPFITAGDPDLATTAEALRVLESCGADVIELGVPCSDPYVDGTTIQASSARALAGGTTMDGVLAMLKEVMPELSCPVVLFSYYRPLTLCPGGLAKVEEAGVHGLIVPDLPYIAADAFMSDCKKHNLELVLLTTPAMPEERMKEVTKASQGFVYLVSVNGVTGPRENVNPQVQSLIQEVKKVTSKPIAVGFGISKPEHAKKIAQWGADRVIIGSAIVRQLGEAASPKEGLNRLEAYARSMKNALPRCVRGCSNDQ